MTLKPIATEEEKELAMAKDFSRWNKLCGATNTTGSFLLAEEATN